jgi:cytochrome c553
MRELGSFALTLRRITGPLGRVMPRSATARSRVYPRSFAWVRKSAEADLRWTVAPDPSRLGAPSRPNVTQDSATRLAPQDDGVRGCGSRQGRQGSVAYLAGLVVLIPALLTPAAAADVAAGRRKALQCQTCHGLDGLSKLPEAPHLAGQPEPYLAKSLNDYRKGVRTHDMMTLVVRDLTDQDVADLAAYYAAIEISVKTPGR